MSRNPCVLPDRTDGSDPDPADPVRDRCGGSGRLARTQRVLGQSTSASTALSSSHAACPARRVNRRGAARDRVRRRSARASALPSGRKSRTCRTRPMRWRCRWPVPKAKRSRWLPSVALPVRSLRGRRPPAKMAHLWHPRGSTRPGWNALRRASADPRPESTRLPKTWGRTRWSGPRATLPAECGADVTVITGDDLLTRNFPLIHHRRTRRRTRARA